MYSTCVGVICKDGVVVAAEKTLDSPFIMKDSNKHIHVISKHIGSVFLINRLFYIQVVGGYNPDGRYAVDRARDHAVQFKDYFAEEMPPRVLAERMGQFIHQFTCYGGYRPLGINLLFAGWDHGENRYDLYRVTPSGQCFVFCILI